MECGCGGRGAWRNKGQKGFNVPLASDANGSVEVERKWTWIEEEKKKKRGRREKRGVIWERKLGRKEDQSEASGG